jgi:outer membrane lipoprotein-sorting protein
MSLLLSLAFLLQEQNAQQTFQKIEESVEKAKTVQVKFTGNIRGVGEAEGVKVTGSIQIKEGNRIRYEVKTSLDGQSQDLLVLSDGKRLSISTNGREVQSQDVPNNLGSQLRTGICRSGVTLAIGLLPKGEPGEQVEGQNAKKLMEVADLKSETDANQGKIVAYRLVIPKAHNSSDVKLWYNSKTYQLLKRTSASKEDGVAQGELTETYDDFSLDVEIPDTRFELPLKK